MRPRDFDVALCCNQLGDLFSDLAGALAGSLGMPPSACLAASPDAEGGRVFGVYENTSGSAPDIAGQGIANPVGTILSVAMMSEYSFGRPDLGAEIARAVERVIAAGLGTRDIGGVETSASHTGAVLAEMRAAAP